MIVVIEKYRSDLAGLKRFSLLETGVLILKAAGGARVTLEALTRLRSDFSF